MYHASADTANRNIFYQPKYRSVPLQCSQPSSPFIFGVGWDGLQFIARLFGGAMEEYAPESEGYRGL